MEDSGSESEEKKHSYRFLILRLTSCVSSQELRESPKHKETNIECSRIKGPE